MKALLVLSALAVPAYSAFVPPTPIKRNVLVQHRTTAPLARIKSTPPKRSTFFGLGKKGADEKEVKKEGKKLFFSIFKPKTPEPPPPSFASEVGTKLVTIGTNFVELQKVEMENTIAAGKERLQELPAELAQLARELPGWAAEMAKESATSAWTYTKTSAENKVLETRQTIEAAPEWVAASTQRALDDARNEVVAKQERLQELPAELAQQARELPGWAAEMAKESATSAWTYTKTSAENKVLETRQTIEAAPGWVATSTQRALDDARNEVVAKQDRLVATTMQALDDAKAATQQTLDDAKATTQQTLDSARNYAEDAYCTVTGTCS